MNYQEVIIRARNKFWIGMQLYIFILDNDKNFNCSKLLVTKQNHQSFDEQNAFCKQISVVSLFMLVCL